MKIARIALAASLVELVLLLIGGPGARLGLWEFPFGFQLLRYALYFGVAGAVLGALFLLIPATRRNRITGLVFAVIIGVAVATVPLQMRSMVQQYPFIHDVTTDTENPPRFVDILPLRADAPNPAEYAGEEVAQQQRSGYPQLAPLHSSLEPSELFDHALANARDQGWEIVAAEPESGRIEATETTFWYGFKDDIVIRIQPEESGSRLDVRSKSRVGGSDLGANAERILAYLSDLKRRID